MSIFTRLHPKTLSFILGLTLIVVFSPAISGPVDCGSTPIRVAQFKLGYRFYIEDGQEKGMNKDIMDELRKRTACNFIVQEMPFARITSDLASGDLDMTLSGIRSPERDKTLWCAPSITAKNFVVIGTAARVSVNTPDDFLNNSKITIRRGAGLHTR